MRWTLNYPARFLFFRTRSLSCGAACSNARAPTLSRGGLPLALASLPSGSLVDAPPRSRNGRRGSKIRPRVQFARRPVQFAPVRVKRLARSPARGCAGLPGGDRLSNVRGRAAGHRRPSANPLLGAPAPIPCARREGGHSGPASSYPPGQARCRPDSRPPSTVMAPPPASKEPRGIALLSITSWVPPPMAERPSWFAAHPRNPPIGSRAAPARARAFQNRFGHPSSLHFGPPPAAYRVALARRAQIRTPGCLELEKAGVPHPLSAFHPAATPWEPCVAISGYSLNAGTTPRLLRPDGPPKSQV